MKCIIADDEHLVRFSIQDMLEELAVRGIVWFDEIRQTADGEELLRMVEDCQPELVFVDIHMPKLNGLDAMECGRHLSPDTQWVILTGYAEFEYAKRAVALGALEYLLKPASAADVERVVSLVLSRITDKRAMEQVSLEHRILGILQDTFSEGSDADISERRLFSGEVIVIDSHLSLRDGYAFQHEMIKDLKLWMREHLESGVIAGSAVLDDGNVICVLSSGDRESLLRNRNRVSEYIAGYFGQTAGQKEDIPFSVCTQFPAAESRSSLTVLLRELQSISADACIRIVQGLGRIVPEARLAAVKEAYIEFYDLLTVIDKIIRDQEIQPAKVLSWLRQNQDQIEELWKDTGISRFFSARIGVDTADRDSVSFSDCIACMIDRISSKGERSKRTPLVADALELLATHYTEEIGLAQVADMMDITPNYLSSEFHKTMGETFTHYLTRLRMEKAAELLRTQRYTVKEVASMVGYGSSRHFGKVFKRYSGHVPTEFMLLDQ